ncbi:signal peptidase I [Neobacillus sp. SCS-31]|uniref:signal peptidase I n=1 Tax=Neobacillus oceani TaxID=3115292 RepID=UPI003905A77B
MRRFIKWIGNFSVAMLVLISASSIYLILQMKIHPNQVPSIFGYKTLLVLSGSMEPLLSAGDMIVMKEIDPANAKVNDVITFKNNANTLVTHRIVSKVQSGGTTLFATKGDANNVEDNELIAPKQITGKLFFHFPKVGYALNFLKSGKGLISFMVVIILFLIIGIIRKYIQDSKTSIKIQ